MKSLITFVMLVAAGQALAGDQVISVQHDSQRGVTCWILNNTGISCLPDSSLLQVPTSRTTDESPTARASLATSMCKNEQLSAAPLPQKKGLQL